MTGQQWPAYADQDPEDGPDDPPELELTEAGPVPAGDQRLPVDVDDTSTALEGTVLPPRHTQPQIRILPRWVQSPSDMASAASWQLEHVARRTVLLVPLWFALLGRSPVGVGRLLRRWWRWSNDSATGEYLVTLRNSEAREYDHLDGRRRLSQKYRRIGSLILFSVACVAVGITYVVLSSAQLGWLPAAAAAVVLVPVLGWHGRSAGQQLLLRGAGELPEPKITAPFVTAALATLGIGELNKALKRDPDNAVHFVDDPMRDGPGWRADIDLPLGVTAGDVIERRGRLASALRRDSSQVWPEGDPESHEGRLVLWVAERPMSKQRPVAWPLEHKGEVDLFEPFPIGTDPRGRPITITLMFALMIIGAMTRMGKTATLRLFLLAAALDVRSELHIYELKGSGDLGSLAPVAHRLVSGDDDDDIRALLADLKELKATMRRRMRRLKGLPRAVCPDNKVTPQLASRRELGLHPILLVLDECHLAFEHPTYGAEIKAILIDIGRRAAAAGIIVILATQRPDADAIPPKLASNAILRFCLKVIDQVANDMILGTSAYKNGIRATMFKRKEAGVGYLVGEGDDPVITRVAKVDDPAAEKIALRARQMRQAAGRLTGEAAGEEFDLPELETGPSMLDHLARLWPDGEPSQSYAQLAELLAEHEPDLYPGCTQQQVSTAIRAAGIPRKKVSSGEHRGRQGVLLVDLEQVLADRNHQPAGVDPDDEPDDDSLEENP